MMASSRMGRWHILQLYEQFAHMGEPSDRSSRLVSAVTWLRHLAHLKQSTWKKDCLEMVRAGDVEHERRTNPKATTRPPCSLTTDFLHPGQSLSSSGTRSAAPLRRSMCECSRRGTSWGAAASIAGGLGQPEICAGDEEEGGRLNATVTQSQHFSSWRSSLSQASPPPANPPAQFSSLPTCAPVSPAPTTRDPSPM